MSDNGKEKEIEESSNSKGAEWEVVSLTSSAYSAAPGPQTVDPGYVTNERDSTRDLSRSSESLFMSGHFVFPPNEHENLPIEPDLLTEIQTEENLISTEDLELENDETGGVQFYEEGRWVSVHDSDFDEREFEERDREEQVYVSNQSEKEQVDESSKGLPCEAWWKRQALSLYRNAKEANTFWSVVVAAAFMGLVILGHRWQREKFQFQPRWRFNISNERVSKILGSIGRLKDS